MKLRSFVVRSGGLLRTSILVGVSLLGVLFRRRFGGRL